MTAFTHKLHFFVCVVSVSFSCTNCRVQLKPPKEIRVDRIGVGPPCTLDVNRDLVDPQPIFLQPGSADFWPVVGNGTLEIGRGENLEMHCTQGFHLKPKTKSINATCVESKTFLVSNEKMTFNRLNCSSSVRYTVRETRISCAENAKLFEVGFNVSRHRFAKTLDICHDVSAVNTIWTYNKLDPVIVNFQKSVQRLNFSKAGFFGKRNMNHFYSKENQRHILQSLLGRNYEKFFNNRTQFLSRGHLSPKVDYIYGTQQRATFNFFNVAPQWQIFNAGTWNAVENGIRKFIASKRIEVECFTGTWGVISFPNARNEPTQIYLAFDENNNGEIPVPKLFYKILVDTRSKPQKGIALIGVNNPYVSMNELKREYVICDDVSEWVPWIRWRRDNLAKGYFYACRVDDFVQVVSGLPRSLSSVSEILV